MKTEINVSILLSLTFNNLPNPVIIIDSDFKILYTNDAHVCANTASPWVDRSGVRIDAQSIIKNRHIRQLISRSIKSGKPLESEIPSFKDCQSTQKVYVKPVKLRDNEEFYVITLQDILIINKAEKVQSEFVSNVTHELKTPLTSIKGFIETLRNGAVKDPEVAEKFLEIIDVEAERLYMLINDILQLSQFENMQKDTNIRPYNLSSIISEVVSILSRQAEKRAIALSYNVDKNLIITANRDRIKQMLINLIDNAIKYNVEEGIVEVKAYTSGNNIIICVRDTGIGIEQKYISRIFDRFYRVDKGRSRSMGGTGLGLSIVKNIVNLYSGDIKVSSSLGEGTEFTISLPMSC